MNEHYFRFSPHINFLIPQQMVKLSKKKTKSTYKTVCFEKGTEMLLYELVKSNKLTTRNQIETAKATKYFECLRINGKK